MIDLNTDRADEPASDLRLSRRTLLRSAAGFAGALAFGLASAPAQARRTAPSAAPEGSGKDAPLAMAFWDGARLTDTASLTADGSQWDLGAKVTLHCRPAGEISMLHALTAHFPVQDGAAVQWTPFTAWAASPGDSGHGTAFFMPVHSTEGLRLSVEHGIGRHDDCRLGRQNLRAGTYLVAPAGTIWQGCTLANGDHLKGRDGQPVSFDHLVLTVTPA